MENLKDYIFVTGASSGIGRSIAVSLSADYNLVLNGRDEERLQKTKLLCYSGNEQLIFKLDLTKVNEIEQAFSTFLAVQNIKIAHYVHCAGLMKMVPLKMITVEMIESTFATNFISASLLTKVLMQRKINNTALKSVVFISSNISNFGAKAFSIYASSKAALDSLMRCLAIELAPRVRVNSILPGSVHTEMTHDIFENKEVIDRMLLLYPLGSGKPEDISNMVQFLISDKARWITGQQFTVDGGRTINISG
jgi:NAD(P)-dependent dehydrogenase (short-subunit alcohol dehydrogenase family)